MALTPWVEALSTTQGTSSGGPTPKGMHSEDQYGPHDWMGRGNKQVSNSGSGWDWMGNVSQSGSGGSGHHWMGENANLYMNADKILEETGVDPLQRFSGGGWKSLLGLGLIETGAGALGDTYTAITGKKPTGWWGKNVFSYPKGSTTTTGRPVGRPPKVPTNTGPMSKVFPAWLLFDLAKEGYQSSFQPEFDPNDPMYDKYR